MTELDQEVFHHIVPFEFAHQRMPTRKELAFYAGIQPVPAHLVETESFVQNAELVK